MPKAANYRVKKFYLAKSLDGIDLKIFGGMKLSVFLIIIVDNK